MKEIRMNGRFVSLCFGLVAALLALPFYSMPALAHSELKDSTPSAGATLSRPPQKIALVFSQDISPEFVTVAVTVSNNTTQRLEAQASGRTVTAEVSANVAADAQGGGRVPWQVAYRVVSADGHAITGSIKFTIATRRTTSSSAPTPSRTGSPSPDEPESAALGDRTPAAEEADGSSGAAIIVIGGLAMAVAGGAALWLVRGRREGPKQ